VHVVAIDWSGRRRPADQRRHVWRADAIDGEIVSLRAGRTRDEVVDDLIEAAARDGERLVVGLDFAFSLPGWYLDRLGLDARALWARLAGETLTPRMQALGLAGWLSEPEAPFWTTARPDGVAGREFRRTERECAAPGIQPKSVFKLVGAGQVGRGSLYGMQALHRLSSAGFAIWPFDPPAFPLALELYPRLLIGRDATGSPAGRAAYLSGLRLEETVRAAAIASVDAFDALVSAVRMAEHRFELARLDPGPEYALEGRFWSPPAVGAAQEAGAVVGTYVAAWNEADGDRRTALLTSACAAGVRYVDPDVDVTSSEALSSVIASFQAAYPAHVLRLASDVDAHHDVLRFAWLVERPDGTTLSAGLDACQRAADGRLMLIAGFFGALAGSR
jgi:hypothetical protein